MTTTISVRTHTWPVKVTTNSRHAYSEEKRSGYGYSEASVFVPAQSTADFSISSTTSVTITELPEDATGLDTEKEAGSNAASATLG